MGRSKRKLFTQTVRTKRTPEDLRRSGEGSGRAGEGNKSESKLHGVISRYIILIVEATNCEVHDEWLFG
jgi:hypothetical protein